MPPVSPRPPPGSSPWRLHQEPVPALVVGGDVDVFSARLLGGETPSVDVVGTFLLLIRVGSFLLQLLPFVFRPPVLEPNFHLGGERERSALGGPGDGQSCNQAASAVFLGDEQKRCPCAPCAPTATLSCLSFPCVCSKGTNVVLLHIPALLNPKRGEGHSVPPQPRGPQAHGALLPAPPPRCPSPRRLVMSTVRREQLNPTAPWDDTQSCPHSSSQDPAPGWHRGPDSV